MANRAGKSEREARNRRKRGAIQITRNGGAAWTSLKLGRKKSIALSRSRLTTYRWGAIAAVPVTDAERQPEPTKSVQRIGPGAGPGASQPNLHIRSYHMIPGEWGTPAHENGA